MNHSWVPGIKIRRKSFGVLFVFLIYGWSGLVLTKSLKGTSYKHHFNSKHFRGKKGIAR